MNDNAEVQAWPAYRPSGKVSWFKFLAGLAATAAVAGALAWCLYRALELGFYLVFIAPLVASLAVGGLWALVLGWSHCRNKTAATLASVALGVVLYVGYYYVGLLYLIGARNAHRVDLLPFYVILRMRTDVANPRPGAAAQQQLPNAVGQGFNWFFGGAELLLVIGVVTGAARARVSKGYCEPCRRWMDSEALKLGPGTGTLVWEGLRRGDLEAARRCLAETSRGNAVSGSITIEHCSQCPAEERPSAVYLTVMDVPMPGQRDPIAAKIGSWFRPRWRGHSALRTQINHVELGPEEVGALAEAFPGLKGTIEAHPERFAEERAVAQEISEASIAAAPALKPTERAARIEAVDPIEAGTILTRGNAVLQTIIGTGSVCGGFALAFAPLLVLASLEAKLPDWASMVAVPLFFGLMLLNIVWAMFFLTYPTSRFMERRTRNAFEMRPGPAVDWHDPDLIFVDIVPRSNWGKMMMENASDIGYLQLDARRKQLIFEGDRERYWVPAESIIEVKHEFWAEAGQHQLQRSPTLHHLIVVRAMTARGPWETWFYQRQNRFRPHTAKRRLADALELEARIRELIGPSA